jgi:putative transposase
MGSGTDILAALVSMLKTSAALRLENLALRQQLSVLRRSAPKRLKVTAADRILWVWLRRVCGDWKSVLMIVKADTVVGWHRKGFRLFWTWKIQRGKRGRPSVPQEVRNLIRMMSRNNPRWGALIKTALWVGEGNKLKPASVLGIQRRLLYEKMYEYGLY